MMNITLGFRAFTLALIALLMPCLGYAQASAPARKLLEFNYGVPMGTFYATLVAKDLGLYEEAGLAPHFFSFQSGAPMLAALKSGSLDAITTGMGTVFAIGQGIPLKIMYWEIDNSAAEALVVDPASGIRDYRDLPKAKKIAAPSGTCGQMSLVLIAKKLGINFKDLNVVNIAPPLFANAFASKSIDAGIAWSPFSLGLERSGLKVVNWAADYSPDGGICPALTSARPVFLEKNPDFGVKMLQVRAKAMDLIAKNPELAITALMNRLSISREVAKATYDKEFTSIPSFEQQVDPSSPASLTAPNGGGLARKLRLASEALAEAGAIPSPLSEKVIADAIDPSHLQRYMKGARK